jgi:antitoxin component YwqK of YwqJK toxin-antitoxin module
MKKLLLIKSLLVAVGLMTFGPVNLKAQDDSNCGIVIDGVLVDKIDCWSFQEMNLIFPITDRHKKYDKIQLKLCKYEKPDDTTPGGFSYDFSPQSFGDNFEGATYGVWKFLTKDFEKGRLGYFGPFGGNILFKRKEFSKRSGNFLEIVLTAYTITGYSYDSYGNKIPNYGNGLILYKSSKVEILKSKYDKSVTCNPSGKKTELKIEKSPAYNDDFGIVKNLATPDIKTSETNQYKSTPTSDNKTSQVNTSSSNSNSTASSATKSSDLKSLDKSKSGYFAEKSGTQISREGYKKGGKLNGELRWYDEGKLREVCTYLNDEKNGPATIYNDEGLIEASGNYKNGEKDGEWKRYKEGKVIGMDVYVNGEKQ